GLDHEVSLAVLGGVRMARVTGECRCPGRAVHLELPVPPAAVVARFEGPSLGIRKCPLGTAELVAPGGTAPQRDGRRPGFVIRPAPPPQPEAQDAGGKHTGEEHRPPPGWRGAC